MSKMGSETADQARTRRRWISLAEFVAVAGLLIGAATLYLNWSDRRQDQAKSAIETAEASKIKAIVTLTGTVASGGRALTLSDPTHTVSEASVRFPTALKVAQQDAMPGPTIQADWFAAPLLKATDGGKDEREGRLPVLITTSWWDGDAQRSSTALYDVLWRTEGRLLGGRKLLLTGLTLKSRATSVAALDTAWKREAPKPD